MRALIYVRVSTDRQADKGQSIQVQIDRCLEYAKTNGYEVDVDTDIYADEGESARVSDRPQFKILRQRCREDESVAAIIFMT